MGTIYFMWRAALMTLPILSEIDCSSLFGHVYGPEFGSVGKIVSPIKKQIKKIFKTNSTNSVIIKGDWNLPTITGRRESFQELMPGVAFFPTKCSFE